MWQCFNLGIKSQLRYLPMRDALNATGRPMLFSICDWQDHAAYWAPELGNSWRTTDDINTGWPSVMRNLLENDAYWAVAGAGQWNDPDMLEVGNGLTRNESVSHFSLWCLVKAPLILGNDLRNMTADTLSILTNAELIALNQDALGVQGHLVSSLLAADVWAGPLADGSVAVVLFNRNESVVQTVTARWLDIGLPADTDATVKDLWLHADVGSYDGSFASGALAPRSSRTIRVTPNNPKVKEEMRQKAERESRERQKLRQAGRVRQELE